MVRICKIGREELSLLKDVELGLGDSEYNRQELEEAGFKRTGVLPIYLDFARYAQPPNPVLLRFMNEAPANVLFVGRVSPNKKHEDLIRLAPPAAYRELLDLALADLGSGVARLLAMLLPVADIGAARD